MTRVYSEKHKPKEPSTEWLNYINENLYYKSGKVFSIRSDYKKPLGSLNSGGYISVVLEPKRQIPRHYICLKIHHLVWYLNNSEWPTSELDHIDRDKLNNDISNLRLSTRAEQKRNSNNLSKRPYAERYIHELKKESKYRVVYRQKVLGTFNTKEEAIELRSKYKL